jgi:hypothetical protein
MEDWLAYIVLIVLALFLLTGFWYVVIQQILT